MFLGVFCHSRFTEMQMWRHIPPFCTPFDFYINYIMTNDVYFENLSSTTLHSTTPPSVQLQHAVAHCEPKNNPSGFYTPEKSRSAPRDHEVTSMHTFPSRPLDVMYTSDTEVTFCATTNFPYLCKQSSAVVKWPQYGDPALGWHCFLWCKHQWAWHFLGRVMKRIRK